MIRFYYCPILGLTHYVIEEKLEAKVRSKKRRNEKK